MKTKISFKDEIINDRIVNVKCKFCGTWVDEAAHCHLHQGEWVCLECWDERLRVTQ